MSPKPFVVPPSGYPDALNVLGTAIIPIATNEATHSYEITVQSGGAGMGPPPHHHAWDESFFILEGTVELSWDDQIRLCEPGTLVHVPGGTVHSFRYGPGGGRMLEITGKGGTAVAAFTAIHKAIPSGPPDIPTVVSVFANHGVIVQVPES